MKKINFLTKIKKQGKLKIVEPSEEISQAYLQRSNESLLSAKTLLKINNLKDSVALAYYSMYYSLTALLFKIGIKSENHSASIILLKEIFNIETKEIIKAKKERVEKQYYIDFNIDKDEALNSIKIAEEFNTKLNNINSTLTQAQIKQFQEKAKYLV